MATEAQRLISISLNKIAHARSHRGGMKLHHSLLVATVLHKARNLFMEETYHMMHAYRYQQQQLCFNGMPHPTPEDQTYPPEAEESPVDFSMSAPETSYAETAESFKVMRPQKVEFDSSSDESDLDDENKENWRSSSSAASSVTIFDLDTRQNAQVLSNSDSRRNSLHTKRDSVIRNCRSRTVPDLKRKSSDSEVEEAVASILPKKCKSEENIANPDGESDSESPSSSRDSQPMEVEQITSLVSIFSFNSRLVASSGSSERHLTRSVSTPDLCASELKKNLDEYVQRTVIALTV